MKKDAGSVLLITLGFILIFTLVGVASIHYAGLQNMDATKRIYSEKAFWLADAAIEKAKERLPLSSWIPTPGTPVTEKLCFNDSGVPVACTDLTSVSSYDLTISNVLCGASPCQHKWKAVSLGETLHPLEKRAIEATIARYHIEDVLITEGPIKKYDKCPVLGSADIGDNGDYSEDNCNLLAEQKDFSFSSVFNGMTLAQAYANADSAFVVDSSNSFLDRVLAAGGSVSGSVYVKLDGVTTVKVPNDKFGGDGFLIIETDPDLPDANVTIQFEGTRLFSGIVWLAGQPTQNINVSFTGNPNFSGAIFVDGSDTDETKVLGNVNLNFDEAAIENALATLGGGALGDPGVVAWKEITL